MGDWTRVVVGVDGSDNSKSALQWAAEEARTHGAELTAVSVWAPIVLPGPHGNVGWATQLDPEEQARTTLQATLDDALGENPGVTVRREIRGGSAAKVLIDLADGADALVVGARGQGGFVCLLLGWVSQHIATNATCTVVVVRWSKSSSSHDVLAADCRTDGVITLAVGSSTLPGTTSGP